MQGQLSRLKQLSSRMQGSKMSVNESPLQTKNRSADWKLLYDATYTLIFKSNTNMINKIDDGNVYTMWWQFLKCYVFVNFAKKFIILRIPFTGVSIFAFLLILLNCLNKDKSFTGIENSFISFIFVYISCWIVWMNAISLFSFRPINDYSICHRCCNIFASDSLSDEM